MLLEKGNVDITQTDGMKGNCLHHVARTGNLKTAELLIDKGAKQLINDEVIVKLTKGLTKIRTI